MKFIHILLTTALTLAGLSPLYAQDVAVQNAWARVTVQGQKATGAFMTLTSKQGNRLVLASSPMAGLAEVHEMKMEGDVMRMRAVQGGLDLPAGKAVELKPGGYHVMLMDLKQPLTQEVVVPLTLVFRNATGQESRLDVKLPVGTGPSAKSGGASGVVHGDNQEMDHSHHKH